METEFITLLAIAAASFLCPIISSLIPNKLIPETVFLLIAGMILGPNVLGIAQTSDALTLLSDLGLGMLFLLAGYEINPSKITGKEGRHGLITWFASFAIAVCVVAVLPHFQENPLGWLAVAIALTTTAFGTLVPILKDRGLVGTQVGDAIVSYGTWGEIMPIIAIALILSTRAAWLTIIILAVFTAIAIVSAYIPKRLWDRGTKLTKFISENSETNAQMTVRAVVLLLVALVAVSAIFNLDIVLGAFSAGFVLRFIIPEGNDSLEVKMNGIGYGFFIPLFFVTSGTKIDPAAILSEPHVLILFIIMLVVIRAVPIFIATKLSPETRDMEPRNRATVALYCTTALPLIVAVTSIATSVGVMTEARASLLIAAGGITVFLMPLLAALTMHAISRHP